MYKFFGVSRSGYYNFTKRLGKPEKDADLAKTIQLCQDTTDKTYGYRRVWLWLKRKDIHRNPIPGEGFGACGKGYFRFSAFGDPDDTKEAADHRYGGIRSSGRQNIHAIADDDLRWLVNLNGCGNVFG